MATRISSTHNRAFCRTPTDGCRKAAQHSNNIQFLSTVDTYSSRLLANSVSSELLVLVSYSRKVGYKAKVPRFGTPWRMAGPFFQSVWYRVAGIYHRSSAVVVTVADQRKRIDLRCSLPWLRTLEDDGFKFKSSLST